MELEFIDRKALDEWLLERVQEEGEELADRHHRDSRRPDLPLAVDLIPVATSDAGLGQVTGLLEVIDDLSRRSFCDPDVFGDFSQARIRVGGYVGEHVAMVGHQAPTRRRVSGT